MYKRQTWIQQKVPAKKRRANLIAVDTALVYTLREKLACRVKRHFLKEKCLNNQAVNMHLRHVLSDQQVYSKHHEPEAAAAIIVMNKFQPHVQVHALLCNYANAAHELNVDAALHDTLEGFRCHRALLRQDQVHLNKESHVCTVYTRVLRWPYLRTLAQRGRKFRLDCDMEDVFLRLSKAFEE